MERKSDKRFRFASCPRAHDQHENALDLSWMAQMQRGATKTIVRRSCRSTANLDGTITFLARYINYIWTGSNKNIYNTLRNVHCANLSTSSAGPGKAGRGFKRYCTRSIAPWNRPQSPHDYRGHVWLATNNSVSPFARIYGSAACRTREGNVDHHGHFFNVVVTFPRTSQIPLLISALGKKAFELSGEIADGAISWMCPVPYLLNIGLPALRTATAADGRSAPSLVAHVIVALSQDRHSVLPQDINCLIWPRNFLSISKCSPTQVSR